MTAETSDSEVAYYNPRADWALIPHHMHGAVRRYVMRGVPPGSFLSAVLANDLMEAIGRADHLNEARLKEWGVFVYNFMPAACHGSYEIVEAWIAKGGILGRE